MGIPASSDYNQLMQHIQAMRRWAAGMKGKVVVWFGRKQQYLMRQADVDRLREHAEVVLYDAAPGLTDEETAQMTGDASAVITTWDAPYYSERVLDRCPNLRFYGRIGGSVQDVIDHGAWDRGIRVVSAVDAQGLLLADLAVSLMLSGVHRFPFFVRQQWGGAKFERVIDQERVPQLTLLEKRVALLGFGAIARHVAALLKPFGCKLSAYDPFVPDAEFERLGVERKTSVAELCRNADVVSVHAAFRESTRGLLGREAIGNLPDGSLIVNTSFGELIDLPALEERLRDGTLFACLDMVEGGMPGPLDRLRYYVNCQITPTISSYSDGVLLMGRQIVDETIRFLNNEPLQHIFTKQALGYRA